MFSFEAPLRYACTQHILLGIWHLFLKVARPNVQSRFLVLGWFQNCGIYENAGS